MDGVASRVQSAIQMRQVYTCTLYVLYYIFKIRISHSDCRVSTGNRNLYQVHITTKATLYIYSRGQKKVNIPFPLHEDDATTKRKRNETKTLERIHDTARNKNGN